MAFHLNSMQLCTHDTRLSHFSHVFFLFFSFVCVFLRTYLHYVLMQVKVNNEVATGTGPNKKVAKRNAAEAMLLQLGYKASTVPQNPTEVQVMLLPASAFIFHICFLYKPPTLLGFVTVYLF